VDEDTLAAEAGTGARDGTSIHGLSAAAEAHGARAEIVEGLTVDDLVEYLTTGCVVVACIQSGDDPVGFGSSHWVVPCAVTDEGSAVVVECMDPAVDGARSASTVDEFAQRWHCIDMGEEIAGLGLILRGDRPANMTAIEGPSTPL
jgi:hypothetical protein